MSPSLLMMEKVTYRGDDLGAEVLGRKGGLVRYQWPSCKRSRHGCKRSRKNRDYQSQLAVAIAEGLVTHLIQILADQSFALCSHGIFDLILKDRTAFTAVVNHSPTVNGPPTLTAISCVLQSFYLPYTHLRLCRCKVKDED